MAGSRLQGGTVLYLYGLVASLTILTLLGCDSSKGSKDGPSLGGGALRQTPAVQKGDGVTSGNDAAQPPAVPPEPPEKPAEPADPNATDPGFEILVPRAEVLSTSLAKVDWLTPHPADSLVRWGTSAALEGTPILQPELVRGHCVLLKGLEAGRTYFYQVASKTASGVSADSGGLQFQTLPKESVVVRPGHPRIFFNQEDIPLLRRRIEGSHALLWAQLLGACEALLSRTVASLATSSNNYDYVRALAFVGLLGGDGRFIQRATEVALECTRLGAAGTVIDVRQRILTLVAVYDWLHAYLSPTNLTALRDAMTQMCSSLESRVNTTEFVWGHSHGHQRPLLLAALAMHGESPDAAAKVEKIVSDYREGYLPTWRNYADGGGSLKGWWYTTWTTNMEVEVFAALRSATGINWFETETWLERLVDWYMRGLRGDSSFLRSGDSRISTGVSYLDWVYALVVAQEYGNPNARWLGAKVLDALGRWDVLNFYEIIWGDPAVKAQQPSGPLSRLYRSPGQVVMRSSWGPDAVIAGFSSAADYTLGHTHRDNNSFSLYYRGGLALDSGTYDEYGGSHHSNYYTRTIAHNSMLVYDPAEKFILYGKEYVNDGGQRWLSPSSDGIQLSTPPHVAQVLDPRCGYRAGGILVYEDTPEYTYSLGDATSSYSPEKLRAFDRHFLWLKSVSGTDKPVIVILDRVEATSPSFRKTYLLHTQNRPEVQGAVVLASNGQGILHHRTLLPSSPCIEVIGGDGREYLVRGVNYSPSRRPPATEEAGAWRVEISPPAPSLADTFLNVLHAGDAAGQAPEAATIDVSTMTGLRVADWVVLFGTSPGGCTDVEYAFSPSAARHLLLGLIPNATYEVRVDGALLAQASASSEGTLRFDCGGGARFEVRRGSAPSLAVTP